MPSSINNTAIRRIYALINATVILIVLFGVFVRFNIANMPNGLESFLAIRITMKNLLVVAIFSTGATMVFRLSGLSRPPRTTPFRDDLAKVVKACTVAALFALVFPLTSESKAFTAQIVFYFWPAAIVACLLGRFFARIGAAHLAKFLTGRRELIIVGSGPRAAEFYRQISGVNHPGFHFLGFVDSPHDDHVPPEVSRQLIGSLEELEAILMTKAVDEVVIAMPVRTCYDHIQRAITTCERAGVEAKYPTDIFESSIATPTFDASENVSVVRMKVVRDDSRLLVKRAIDVVGAIVGIFILAPLMLLTALAVGLTSKGPVLYTQERFGWNKRRFRMYKFRTMVENADGMMASLENRNEQSGPIFKIRNDPRITSLGRLLRVSSIDELPQLFNVLRGDMSLVGPRPMAVRDVLRFDDVSLMRRFSVKPGLTCLWQVSGRSNTDFLHWIALDLKYIDTWSLTLDFQILAKTIPAVLTGNGAV